MKAPSGVGDCVVLPDAETLAQRGAAWLLNRALAAAPGPFALCLSGGSTPRRLYELLAAPPYRDCFPWPRAHWFWGDERFVAPDDKASNYRMAREALFDRAPVPPANIHPVPTQAKTPADAAAEYARMLQRFYGATALSPKKPLFQATLLGLGPDGHTASLFPGSAALGETRDWTAAVAETASYPRITLTYPALDSSAAVAFLVSGVEKRGALARLSRGEALPAARVKPLGSLTWLLDREAAAT
jgi:6-phosphogluconolactonase